MNSKDYRRVYAAERKFIKALKYLEDQGVISEVMTNFLLVPETNTLNATGFFKWQGKNRRVDWGFSLSERLPSVKVVRGTIWRDLNSSPW